MPSHRTAEADMLRTIAFFDPIDHIKLRRLMAEWYGVIEFETFKTVRSNLTDLGLIEHPKMDEHYFITEDGWRQLGAETPLETEETWSSLLY